MFGVVGSTLNLVPIVIESNDLAASKSSHLTGRASHSTPDIEDLHALLQLKLEGHVMFMASKRLEKPLVDRKAAEVKRLGPSLLVEISGKVVVAAYY